ncbi:heme exporter protein CcmD [Granulosicoccaceae sp. 1_MG-2023]|nr:heme exporter protein CcmD [Granulosicoccaceae sp. 1_MG-2023]
MMTEFLQMGGYALYVWPSFALGMLVLLYNVAVPLLTHRAALRRAADFHAGRRTNGEQIQ